MRFGNQNFIFSGSIIKDGLVLYYDATSSLVSGSYGYNGSSTWNSVIGVPLTITNPPIVYTSSYGGSLIFSNNPQIAAVTYNQTPSTLTNATVFQWFNVYDTSSGAARFCAASPSSSGNDFDGGFTSYFANNLNGSGISGVTIEGGFRGSFGYNTTNYFAPYTMSLNKWYCFAYTVDSSYITAYVNGVKTVSQSRVNNGSSTIGMQDFIIGQCY